MNGVLTAKLHIVAIITTLGTMTILRGLTYLYTGGYPVMGSSEEFKFIGVGYLGPIPFPILIFLSMVAAVAVHPQQDHPGQVQPARWAATRRPPAFPEWQSTFTIS